MNMKWKFFPEEQAKDDNKIKSDTAIFWNS